MDKSLYDLIVVGGGACGCVAAITAARNNKKVLLLEKNSQIAKKLLVTGNGKCNFTNYDMDASKYHGNQKLIQTMLDQFNAEAAVEFFHSIGITAVSRNGYVYPASNQAKSMLTALDFALYKAGVKVITNYTVNHVNKDSELFFVTNGKDEYVSKAVLLSTGLLDSTVKGVERSALDIASVLGHHYSVPLPALCGYYCDGIDFKRLAGVRCKAKISVLVNGECKSSDSGELQFNDYGLSGIPVFQLSSFATRALHDKKNVEFVIDFLESLADAKAELEFRVANFKEPLNGLLPDKICVLTKEILGKNAKAEDYYNLLSQFSVSALRAREYQYSQICIGGIDTKELKAESTESSLVPGLYFGGELIDVDGLCGGYNLHFAWATGHFVGSSI